MATPAPTRPPPTASETAAIVAVIAFVAAADTVTSPGWLTSPSVVVTLLFAMPAFVLESTTFRATAPAPATPTPTRPPPTATEAAAAITLIVERDTLTLSETESYVRTYVAPSGADEDPLLAGRQHRQLRLRHVGLPQPRRRVAVVLRLQVRLAARSECTGRSPRPSRLPV